MQDRLTRLPVVGNSPPAIATRAITALVHAGIRRVAGWVGSGVERSITGLQPLIHALAGEPAVEEITGPARDALVAAINGILGDHLLASNNPLAISMQLRRHGRALPQLEGGRVALLIHGLCMSDRQWRRKHHDHGASLETDLGFRPAYLRYNSGLHVSINGRELAERLEHWIADAAQPVTELVIVGYSIGGLVARSACHYGKLAGHRWLQKLSRIVFIATPHLGAPLERGGNTIDFLLSISSYSAPLAALGRVRSAAITDLRHGNMLDEDWKSRDRFKSGTERPQSVPLPRGVYCATLAGTTGHRNGDIRDRLLGDGLVPIASGLGQDPGGARDLAVPKSRQWIGHGIHHFDLLSDPNVYAELRRQLEVPLKKPRRG